MSNFHSNASSNTTPFSRLNMEYQMNSSVNTSNDDDIPERQSTFDGMLPNNEGPKFCEPMCCQLCSAWFGLVVLGLVIGAIAFLFFPLFGTLVVAMTPAVVILGLARYVYENQVTVGQMIVSFFETILWMLPLLCWDMIWFAIDAALDKDSGVCALCLLAYFLQAYFFAGFCEEFVKYLVIARLTHSPLTKDWRSMLVYGLCAGAGFGTLENVMYVAQFGLATGIVRGFVSVPLHCSTGAIIGLNLANRRPVDCGDGGMIDSALAYSKIVPQILLFPWLIHGTFDFCIMVSTGAATKFSFIGFIVALLVFLAGVGYARHLTLYTLTNNPAVRMNIHDKIVAGDPAILGEDRISVCCVGKTTWVCDCFFMCSCCCRSTLGDLELTRTYHRYNSAINTPGAAATSPPASMSPYQNQNQQVASPVVYVHTV